MSKKENKTTYKDCSICGMCRANCPTHSVRKAEQVSPRGRMILKKNDRQNLVFYECTLCGACEVECPYDIPVSEEIRKERETLARQGNTPEAVKKMIENMKKYGNPYGKVEKGKMPKELYSC